MLTVRSSIANDTAIPAYGYFCSGSGPLSQRQEYLKEISAYCSDRNLILVSTFSDTGNAPAQSRPGFRSMISAVRQLGVGIVVIPTPWHFARDNADLILIGRIFRKIECTLMMTGHTRNTPARHGAEPSRRIGAIR
ncbi:recombinase family protein [Lentzea sp. NPDC042327]|uniref:recombinase family protein n=1 Tax=Lentzea sp. NPDC042327 TaxID=3154801 RepID=UPI0033D54415